MRRRPVATTVQLSQPKAETVIEPHDWELVGIIIGAAMLLTGVAATVVLIYP